jgi:diacylglycerol kinase (ATP)
MKNKFSIRARVRSFEYAFAGIRDFFEAEHNAILHLVSTAVVICLGVSFRVSVMEWIALVFAIGFVWVAELFNTAIEKIMDFISMEKRSEIKFIKDLSAAAVLVAAITALVTGAVIFIPKIFS